MSCHLKRLYAYAVMLTVLAVVPIAYAQDGDTSSAGGVLAVDSISERLYYDTREAPLAVLLSRESYPVEDGHLDAIVWINRGGSAAAKPEGKLHLVVRDRRQNVLSRDTIAPIPAPRLFVSLRFPSRLAGSGGSLDVTRVAGGEKDTRSVAFSVRPTRDVDTAGRVRLTIPNGSGVTFRGLPVTVGVPFPRGALRDPHHVRLVDEECNGLPLQARVTGRWSRFGTVRWLECSFVCNLDGNAKVLYLEYGDHIRPTPVDSMRIDVSGGGFPRIQAGRVRVGPSGLAFDPIGRGRLRPVLAHGSVPGGFVVDGEGVRHVMPADGGFVIEQTGGCKTVVRAHGWYRSESGARFCQFVTRYVVFRDSPVLHVFNTWIFTGDGNRETVRDMGWSFPCAARIEPLGFLTGPDAEAEWVSGDYLVQHDHDAFQIARSGAAAVPGRRAPGAFGARMGPVQVFVGIRDFWQNFPRELEYDGNTLVFHEWPRHGAPRRHETITANKLRLWFCHEGERLSFRLPDAYTQPPIFTGLRHETYWRQGTPEDVNAQGVAKTSEMWLVMAGGDVAAADAARLMTGLNTGALRAVVDPKWMAATGAFGDIHHRDVERYPEDERVYELHALAPMVWAERARMYGKWIWGNMLWSPDLFSGDGGIYRAFRKAHQGWPYTWIPFVRSGDLRFFGFADAATRTMSDVCFSHYSDEKTDRRMRGQWYRGALPWAAENRGRPGRPFVPVLRGYSEEVEYLWRCYHLTGYDRAKDVIEDWSRLVKEDVLRTGHLVLQPGKPVERRNTNLLKTFLDMYQETFDPWFLAAAHQIARGPERPHLKHFWKPANRDFERFVGSEEFTRWYVEEYARKWAAQHDLFTTGGWASACPQIESAAHAYLLTGDVFFLRRAVGWLNYTRAATYDGDPDFMRGSIVREYNSVCGPSYTAYYLRQFPHAIFALERAGHRPAPLPSAFFQLPGEFSKIDEEKLWQWRFPTVAIRKGPRQEVPLVVRLNQSRLKVTPFQYSVRGPDGAETITGSVLAGEEARPVIPSSAPAGTYRLRVTNQLGFVPGASSKITFERGLPGLWLPVSPPGIPEVLEFDDREPVGRGYWKTQYWLRVPEDVDDFTVDFPLPVGRAAQSWAPLNRISVFDPDRKLAWRHQYCARGYQGPNRVAAIIKVEPQHRGRLWQITVPGRSFGFRLDPRIPSILATSPDRWFLPGQAAADRDQ